MDISAWLRGLGLERYGQAFRENAIDEASLPKLTAEAAQPGRNVHDVHTHTSPHSSAGDNRRHVRE
jgi:hypothetical protein